MKDEKEYATEIVINTIISNLPNKDMLLIWAKRFIINLLKKIYALQAAEVTITTLISRSIFPKDLNNP